MQYFSTVYFKNGHGFPVDPDICTIRMDHRHRKYMAGHRLIRLCVRTTMRIERTGLRSVTFSKMA